MQNKRLRQKQVDSDGRIVIWGSQKLNLSTYHWWWGMRLIVNEEDVQFSNFPVIIRLQLFWKGCCQWWCRPMIDLKLGYESDGMKRYSVWLGVNAYMLTQLIRLFLAILAYQWYGWWRSLNGFWLYVFSTCYQYSSFTSHLRLITTL